MAEKESWKLICINRLLYIYGLKLTRFMRFYLTIFLFILNFALNQAIAQTYSKQSLSFTLADKTGKTYTDEAIINGTVKIYSLRDAKMSRGQQLTFTKENNLFTFSEEVFSPGLSLAFVNLTDTMYVEVYGRSAVHRVLDGIKLQKGSFSLTSNDFAAGKTLKINQWETYLTEEVPVKEQNLAEYARELAGKKPVLLLKTSNTN